MNVQQLAADISAAYVPSCTGVQSRIAEPDTVQAFLAAVDDGNYIETAAELAGLSKVTVYAWIKRGDEGEEPFLTFANAVKRASARAEAAEVAKVRQAGNDPRFWAASMTYLERRHPDRWARRSEESNTPRVIVQIGARDSDVRVSVVESSSAPPSRSLYETSAPTVESLEVLGNHNGPYQTQTNNVGGESLAIPPAPMPAFGASEAKGRGRKPRTPKRTRRTTPRIAAPRSTD